MYIKNNGKICWNRLCAPDKTPGVDCVGFVQRAASYKPDVYELFNIDKNE